MTIRLVPVAAVISVLMLAGFASAQTTEKKQPELKRESDESLNHFGVSYRVGLNVNVRFKNIGAFQPHNPGPVAHVADHEYDDGYVRTDREKNQHPFNENTTWNYAYAKDDGSQYLIEQDQLAMHSTFSSGVASKEDSDPRHGFELTYSRQLGHAGHGTWGVEGAFNYMETGAANSQPSSSKISQITDLFNLNGVRPPVGFPAPGVTTGHGTFEGPESVISDYPNRTVDSNFGTATSTGWRKFDANIYGFRLGPYLKIPLCKRADLLLGGGLALAQVDSRFSYQERIVFSTGGGPFSPSGSGSHSELMAGGYLSANLSAKLSSRIDAFAGVQFQSMGTYRHTENHRTAELDLSQSLFFVAGLGYSF